MPGLIAPLDWNVVAPSMACGVLLACLLVFVLSSVYRANRRRVTFPTFSLSIESVSHEDAYVNHVAEGRTTSIYVVRSQGKDLRLMLPKGMTDEEVAKIVPELALGLSKLGYSFSIYGQNASSGEAVLAHSEK